MRRKDFFVCVMVPIIMSAPIPLIFATLAKHSSRNMLIGTIISFISTLIYLVLVCRYLTGRTKRDDYDGTSSYPKKWALIGLFYCICFGAVIALHLSYDCQFPVDYYYYQNVCDEGCGYLY